MATGNLTGSYLLTATVAKPGPLRTVCAALYEDGSVLGWKNSGTVTIEKSTGQFFIVGRQLTAWVPIHTSGGGFAVFTAYLPGGPTITNTAIALFNAQGYAFQTYAFKTGLKGSC